MTAEFEVIVAEAPVFDEPLSYFHELDDTLYTVTSATYIGAVYELFGLRNIADATESDTDYPQLSAEFIVSEDPDLIFLADTKCCGASAESVSARPGWGALSAVSNGSVFAMDDDIASRPGPRLVDYARSVAEALASLAS
jgi:iron complex transport system substrate-binding protein